MTPKKPTAKSSAKPTVKAAAKPAAKKIAAKPAAPKAAKATVAKAAGKATVKAPVKKPTAKQVVKPTTAKVVKTPKAAPKATVGKAAPKTPLKKAAVKPAPKKAAPKTAKPVAKEQDNVQRIAQLIAKTLDTNKAEAIVSIPLAGRSSLADWMIIASGKSSRQVGALANYVQRAFAENGYKRLRTEGLPQGDWVVIDSGDVVVHLFRPEVRDFYQLEKLWQEEDADQPTQKKTLR